MMPGGTANTRVPATRRGVFPASSSSRSPSPHACHAAGRRTNWRTGNATGTPTSNTRRIPTAQRQRVTDGVSRTKRGTMFGYHGRYLRIDLTSGLATWVPLAESVLRRFLGGVGLATYLMHREAPAGVEPLAPAAPLIFCLSPLVGTPLTTSAKFAVVAKSPLTDRLNDALSSSHFALAAKRAGCDALVLVGARRLPSLVILDEGHVRIESAGDLWGLPGEEAAAQ